MDVSEKHIIDKIDEFATDKVSVVVSTPNEQRKMNIGGSNHRSLKKIVYERKPKKPIACIPFQSTTDSLDKTDSWRTWSCIRLAHLLKDAYAIQKFNTAPVIADTKTGKIEEGISKEGISIDSPRKVWLKKLNSGA